LGTHREITLQITQSKRLSKKLTLTLDHISTDNFNKTYCFSISVKKLLSGNEILNL